MTDHDAANSSPVRLRLIGEGAAARIHESRDPAGAPAALKVSRTPEHNPTLEREAEMAALLRHPALLPILERGTDGDGSTWLLMPLLSGETLADWSGNDTELLEMLAPVADALDLLHHHGWGHADLKPENLLLNPADAAFPLLLGDLGLVGRLGETVTGGSPAYLSPGRLDGEAFKTQDDLHAFAVLLFEKLAGALPFERTSGEGLLAAIRKGELRDLTHFRPELPLELDRLFRDTLCGVRADDGVMSWLDEVRGLFGLDSAPRCLFLRELPEVGILRGPALLKTLTAHLYSISREQVQPGHEELIVIEELASAAPGHLRICMEFLLHHQWLRDEQGWARFRQPPAVWRPALEAVLRGDGGTDDVGPFGLPLDLGLTVDAGDEEWTAAWDDNGDRLDLRLRLVKAALILERWDWLLDLPWEHLFAIADRGSRDLQAEALALAADERVPARVNARARIWEVLRFIRLENLPEAEAAYWSIEPLLDLDSSAELSRLLTYQLLDAGRIEEGFAFLTQWKEARQEELDGTEFEIQVAAREITAYARYGDPNATNEISRRYWDRFAGRKGAWYLNMAFANIATSKRDKIESLEQTKLALEGLRLDGGRPNMEIQLLVFLAGRYIQSGKQEYWDQIPKLFIEAEQAIVQLGDAQYFPRLQTNQGIWEMQKGNLSKAEVFFLQATQSARECGQLNRAPHYSGNLALIVFMKSDYRRLMPLLDSCAYYSGNQQDVRNVLLGKDLRCQTSIAFGDIETAQDTISTALPVSIETSSYEIQGWFHTYSAMVNAFKGDVETAVEDCKRAYECQRKTQSDFEISRCRLWQIDLSPDPETDADALVEIIRMLEEMGTLRNLPHAWRLLARHLRTTGDFEGAARALERGHEAAREMGNPEDVWPLHVEAAELARAAGAPESARAELNAAARVLRDLSLHFEEGPKRDLFLARPDRADVLRKLREF